jgi:diacylglycerol kinase family enzyme
MQKVSVILNARAGALIRQDAREIRAKVEQGLNGGGRAVEITFAKGGAMLRAIDQAVAGDHDTIIVGGGDGSVSYAAGKLARSDKLLGVLPLGTLNLLARDLGMPEDLAEALAALSDARPMVIDLAQVNGRSFHSLSGLGFFSQMARAREETRDFPHRLLRVGLAALRALSRTGRLSLELDVDGKKETIEAYAALVTCNRFGGADWRRDALDGGMLEIHVAKDEGGLKRLIAGADLISGQWRDNPGIHSHAAHRVRIASRRRRAWVATDGELRREAVPLEYSLLPRALRVLVPASMAAGTRLTASR